MQHGYSPRALVLGKNSVIHRAQSEITVHDLWQVLLKRRFTFLVCFSLAVLAALIASLLQPTRYEAVGRLTADFESSGLQDLQGLVSAGGADAETKLQTQVSILQTDSLAWDVIKGLRLDQRSQAEQRWFDFGSAQCQSGPEQSSDKISPECRRALLDEFHRRLQVRAVPHTEIIEISFRNSSRELAANVVNTIAEAYVERNFRTKYQSSMRVASWLSGQLDDAKRNAETAEEKFIAYQKQTGVIGTDENHNVLIERLNAINQQLVVAEANRIVREARYRVVLNGDPESLAEVVPGTALQLLHAEETALKDQYAQLDAKYGEAYPKVMQVKAQLAQAREATERETDRIRDKIKTEYQAALNSETMLRAEFERQKQDAYKTNEAAIQVALLKRDVDAGRELYEQLSKKLKEAGILAGLKATNVTIIDPATIPVRPAEPHLALNLVLGLLVGSLGGLGMCFLLENLDTTIATPNDIVNMGTLAALGIVPRLRNSGRLLLPTSRNGTPHIAALEEPEGEMADAYRSLRTALLLSSAGAPPRVLLITSALPREGKTTTSINTAVVFAQHNRRVLLVDGDLRRADLRRCLNLPSDGGLSAALVGEDPSAFYVPHPDLPNLVTLPAGTRPPKPPDLLDSDRMRELFRMWREQFDHVVIDSPPIIGLSDSVILATMVDAVVIVVRAQQSQRHNLLRVQETLATVDAKVSGVIINDALMKNAIPYGYDTSRYSEYYAKKGRNNGRARN